jgi:hypothetical protein
MTISLMCREKKNKTNKTKLCLQDQMNHVPLWLDHCHPYGNTVMSETCEERGHLGDVAKFSSKVSSLQRDELTEPDISGIYIVVKL